MSDDAGLKVTVSADVQQLQAGAQQSVQSLQSMEKELIALGRVIDNTIAKGQDISKLEDAYQALTDKIKAARAEASQPLSGNITSGLTQDLQSVSAPIDQVKSGVQGLGLTLGQQRTAFIDFGRIVTGQGFSLRSLASNFALLGPGVAIGAAALYGLYEVLTKQTDAEKQAEEQAKKLAEALANLKSATQVSDQATGSEQGNIARVQDLAAAIQNTNLSYKDRNNALQELRETNKAYFGDLTLEAASLATLTQKVNDYSNAIIAEAVVKGQVDAISKVSAELTEQSRILDQLKTKRDAANEATLHVDDNIGGGGIGNIGGGANISETARLTSAASSAESAYQKQGQAVATLHETLNGYTDALKAAILEQIQFKPLEVPPKTKSDLQDIVSILKEVAGIYADLSKPQKGPLFIANENSGANLPAGQTSPVVQVIQAQIDAAKKKLADAANDPQLAAAYQKLVTALGAKMQATLNPDLSSPVDQPLANPADFEKAIDKAESQIEKAIGPKGLEIAVPASIKVAIKDSGFDKADQEILLKKAEDDALRGLPPVQWTPNIQVIVNKGIIVAALNKQLNDSINTSIKNVATSGLEGIGQAIGTAIAKGTSPIEAAGKAILTALGQLMEDIGKSLISYGVAKELLDTVLLGGIALPGVVAIGLGVAAEALGALVKSAGSSYHAFATGGIVTGPTLGLVGEAGPEAIFPLSQLNRFIQGTPGSQAQNVTVQGVISGNNLRLALARTNKQQGLV